MKKMNKQLSIGEVGTINGKTVLCVKEPMVYDHDKGEHYPFGCCMLCAFAFDYGESDCCPPCKAEERTDKTDVFYPEIKKGI